MRAFPFHTLRFFAFVAIVAVLFGVPARLPRQSATATVSGYVTDASAARLPNAKLEFSNTSTGVVTSATTNVGGLFRITGLQPGVYRATVTMEGFKTSVQEGLNLHIEDDVTLNYSLSIGVTTEAITVNADANILETSSPTVSQVIEGRQVEDTPLNGRNAMNLVALSPSVTAQGGTNGVASNNTGGGAFTNAFGFGNYSIAGGLAGDASTYVDGAPINIAFGNLIAFVITQDAVQEFRVESSVVNPRYGQFGGGVISFGTKSGGNRFSWNSV